MKIRDFTWSNYRRLPDGNLQVRDHLVLVGPNDTGKSSIVRALNMCLGMAHAQLMAAVSARDFTDQALPLTFTVTLSGIEDDDRAAFPDEITVGPPDLLVVALEASLDPVDPDQKTVRRYFPDGGHGRAPTKNQLKAIGFQFVPAARSLLRELGGGTGGAVRSLLSGLDLAAGAPALATAADAYRTAIDGSAALGEFRGELATALSNALPVPVPKEHVRVVSEAEALDDPLSGVTVTIRDGDHHAPLAEQSDGIRALSVLALLGMSHKTAKIVAVDEPETHLHPTAQRSISRSLRAGGGQRVLVTHSPSVVAEMNPMDVVAFRADRQARQLPADAAIVAPETMVRHWSNTLIEPLTARRVMLVEGVSDRILLVRVAELTGIDLNRQGIAVLDLGGAGLFSNAYRIFGPGGFDVPLCGLVDEDARAAWADEVGVAPDDLQAHGYVVCDPDLEGVYIDALGVDVVLAMLLASPLTGERSILDASGAAAIADITRGQLWAYCRHGKRKVPAALAVAASIDTAQANALTPITQLLALAS